MSNHVWLCLALASVLGACSADPPSASSDHHGGGLQGPSGSGVGAGSSGNGFGNVNAPPPAPVGPSGLVDGSVRGPDQDGGCGHVSVEPEIKMIKIPGNLLIIFDESLSMNEQWNGMGAKWQVGLQSLTAALTPLAMDLNIGLVLFPTGGLCDVAPITTAPQINFMPGPQFLTAFAASTAGGPVGATPLGDAMAQADAALAGQMFTGTTSVLVMTDGDPNCGTDNNQVLMFAASWFAKGIKTYVVGLPGVGAAGNTLLSQLATMGGTNMFITPDDPMKLQTELAMIIGQQVTTSFDSCRIGLPYAPPAPDEVVLIVVENGLEQRVDRDLGKGGGWTLASGGLEIVLQGALCDLAKMGQYEKISVAFGCVDLPPLPPPIPPE